MNLDKISQSKLLQAIIMGVAVFAVLFLVLSLGIFIGRKRADFSFRWAEQYHQNFAGPKGGFFQDFTEQDIIGAHGIFGQIIKIDPSTDTERAVLTIMGKGNVEEIVLVGEDAVIKTQKNDLDFSELKVGDSAVVIGSPNNQGQIEAKLIRIMPPPPESFFPRRKLN